MKKSLSNNSYFFLAFLLILLSACVKKNPGPGGTATISGVITGQNFTAGELEKQQLIFTGGDQI